MDEKLQIDLIWKLDEKIDGLLAKSFLFAFLQFAVGFEMLNLEQVKFFGNPLTPLGSSLVQFFVLIAASYYLFLAFYYSTIRRLFTKSSFAKLLSIQKEPDFRALYILKFVASIVQVSFICVTLLLSFEPVLIVTTAIFEQIFNMIFCIFNYFIDVWSQSETL